MAGDRNWMIIKVPSNPTHSVTVQLTPKSKECTESSSSSLFQQPGVHRTQKHWEWNNPRTAPGAAAGAEGLCPSRRRSLPAWHRHSGRKPSTGCQRGSKHCTWIPLTLQSQASMDLLSADHTAAKFCHLCLALISNTPFYIYIVLSDC